MNWTISHSAIRPSFQSFLVIINIKIFQIILYDIIDSPSTPIKAQISSNFACSVTSAKIYETDIYCLEIEKKVTVRTFQVSLFEFFKNIRNFGNNIGIMRYTEIWKWERYSWIYKIVFRGAKLVKKWKFRKKREKITEFWSEFDLQGTIKEILSLPEMEGDAVMLELNNSWICIPTSNGFLRIYDLTGR